MASKFWSNAPNSDSSDSAASDDDDGSWGDDPADSDCGGKEGSTRTCTPTPEACEYELPCLGDRWEDARELISAPFPSVAAFLEAAMLLNSEETIYDDATVYERTAPKEGLATALGAAVAEMNRTCWAEEGLDFLTDVLPRVQRSALRLPDLFPGGALPMLPAGANGVARFGRAQAHCLLAHAFFCNLPQAWRGACDVNMREILTAPAADRGAVERVKCLLCYLGSTPVAPVASADREVGGEANTVGVGEASAANPAAAGDESDALSDDLSEHVITIRRHRGRAPAWASATDLPLCDVQADPRRGVENPPKQRRAQPQACCGGVAVVAEAAAAAAPQSAAAARPLTASTAVSAVSTAAAASTAPAEITTPTATSAAATPAAAAATVLLVPRIRVVDFANATLHIGRVIASCTQEECLFSARPELFVAMLVCETLNDDEAVLVRGAVCFSRCEGYGAAFRFNKPASYGGRGRGRGPPGRPGAMWLPRRVDVQEVVAIDALQNVGNMQYVSEVFARDLGKAHAGFSAPSHDDGDDGDDLGEDVKGEEEKESTGVESGSVLRRAAAPSAVDVGGSSTQAAATASASTASTASTTSPATPLVISTGCWGCGVFGGAPSLKFVQQLLAASVVEDVDLLLFSTYGNPGLAVRLRELHRAAVAARCSVADLYKICLRFDTFGSFEGHLERELRTLCGSLGDGSSVPSSVSPGEMGGVEIGGVGDGRCGDDSLDRCGD